MKILKSALFVSISASLLLPTLNAKDLSEAIKDVDVSGYLRYRLDSINQDSIGYISGDDSQTESKHIWKGVANFTIPASETFSAVVGVEYNNDTNTGASTNSGLGRGATVENGGNQEGIAVRQFYGVWTPDDTKTSVQVGKFNLVTPLSDPEHDRATGIIATNSDVENVTFLVAALDTWYADGAFQNRENNIYAGSVMGGYKGFSAQLWVFNVEELIDALVFAELGYTYDMFGLTGQYYNNSVKTSSQVNSPSNNKGYVVPDTYSDSYELWTLQASIDWSILSATVGYMGSSENGYFVQIDNQAAFINYGGEQWYGNGFGAEGIGNGYGVGALNSGSMSLKDGGKNELEVWWLTAMIDTTWKDISVGADYVSSENNTVASTGQPEINYDGEEWVGRVNWKASDAWNVYAYYSALTYKQDTANKATNYDDWDSDKFRFEAKYSF
jgi:hypothetical protein